MRSMTWANWVRTWPLVPVAMPAGQWTISGVRVPPSQVYRFQRRNGVFPAHAQAQE